MSHHMLQWYDQTTHGAAGLQIRYDFIHLPGGAQILEIPTMQQPDCKQAFL
ncbi:predicted protein [Sclerotinia sclerotiorum 1980 UF-70]|uniref:Uncharacterized protein n=1 Tax=Sclerotinia sclerotiorum (strain ATCC 18683 / 1980 / Ss-1) TaxID=665079 RepID=A7ET67_SCLS1|nr:predicted protein [Sclerotinia sclerotiorum 1980 UF-70]EDN92659.1 predicted protein [Sclerotinia sclerotiorum 1980 UF-70]